MTTQPTTTTQPVCIIGPNLLDQSKGQYHVHAAGCADTKKAQYRMHQSDVNHPIAVTSVQECVEYVYADFLDEPEQWEDFASDVYFFPCTETLPYATPTA